MPTPPRRVPDPARPAEPRRARPPPPSQKPSPVSLSLPHVLSHSMALTAPLMAVNGHGRPFSPTTPSPLPLSLYKSPELSLSASPSSLSLTLSSPLLAVDRARAARRLAGAPSTAPRHPHPGRTIRARPRPLDRAPCSSPAWPSPSPRRSPFPRVSSSSR
jgi:hypothetical protein